MRVWSNNLKIFLFFSLAGLAFFSSCDHSYFDTEQWPEYAYGPVLTFPLINSSLTIEDIIKDEENEDFYYDEDNLVILVYKNQLNSTFAGEVINLPDQEFQKVFTLDVEGKNVKQVFSENFTLNVTGNERLDSIEFKSGNFLFQISAPELQDDGFGLDVGVVFPGSRSNNGNELSFNLNLNQQENIDLGGYFFPVISDSEGHNQIQVVYELTITGTGNGQNAPYQVELNHNFVDLKFERIFGYLGQNSFILGSGRIPVSLFTNISEGTIELIDPSMKITAHNSFGLPIDVLVNDLYAVDENSNNSITGFPNPWHINSPSLNQVGMTATTEVVINAENSNIAQVMANFPREIFYDLGAILNPDDEQQNFVFDDSQLTLDLEVELPLHGLLSGTSLKDTFDIEPLDSISEVQWVELNFNITNGFPLDAILQIELLDENNILLLDLFGEDGYVSIIESGQVDDQGIVIAAGHKETKVTLDNEQVNLLLKASRIAVSSRMTSANDGQMPVKILSDYSLDINIGIRMKAKTEVSF